KVQSGGGWDSSNPYRLKLTLTPPTATPTPTSTATPETVEACLLAVADAYVSEPDPNGTYGDSVWLSVGDSDAEFMLSQRTLVKFDLTSLHLPDDATIVGARFEAYLAGAAGGENATIDLHDLNRDWDEATVTWNNRPPAASLQATANVGMATDLYVGWEGDDFTALVDRWYRNTVRNRGFMLLHRYEGGEYTNRTFRSRETTFGPRLTIYYTTADPDAQDDLCPTSDRDYRPPDVEARHAPEPGSSLEPLRITADADDDVGLMRVEIHFGGFLVQTCDAGGARWARCVYEDTVAPGLYLYYATAYDLAGNGTSTPAAEVRVILDGQAPQVLVSHVPRNPSPGEAINFVVVASDEAGLQSVRLRYNDQETIWIPGDPGDFLAEVVEWTPPEDTWRVIYWASALDEEDFYAATPFKTILIGNDGPDGDDDFLSDEMESRLCTDPFNPDTDHDAILDGWELLGQEFSDGTLLDLPFLGANPCRRDAFLELDWEAGYEPPDDAVQMLVNAYGDQGIALHVDMGQWGGGNEVPFGQYVEVTDAREPESDARRLWTFHYGWVRNRDPGGRSGYCCGSNINVKIGPNWPAFSVAQEIMHELGHSIGLGHGGRTEADTQLRDGNFIYYSGNWDNTNRKPNYPGSMNYGYYSETFWDPVGLSFQKFVGFSQVALPTLDERHLDERPNSDFAEALAAYLAPAGLVPIVFYSCLDPDDDQGYVMVSDGLQTVARMAPGEAWQTADLPAHPPGIDWNCDGEIEADVAANINGDGGDRWVPDDWPEPSQELVGRDDWSMIPWVNNCPGLDVYSAEYRAAADNPPCPGGLLAQADESLGQEPQGQTGTLEEAEANSLPGEFCDGLNNDGDDQVDEGCPDQDGDQIVDALDNCPDTPNVDQADLNHNYTGDACEAPPGTPTGLAGRALLNAIQLTWQAPPGPGVVGYNVYRVAPGDTVARFLGGYPSTATPAFTDGDIHQTGVFQYQVAAVTRYGSESIAPAEVQVQVGHLYTVLPLVLRQ
ncbi:MAG: DNRLRE domain-containing protein, partial [Anaerolineae bacterium]